MRTVEDRLRFILDFARLDLDRLRPGDWLNLREDLCGFIFGAKPNGKDGLPIGDTGGIMATPLVAPLPQDMTLEDFRQLQAKVKAVLDRTFSEDYPTEGDPGLGELPLRWWIINSLNGHIFLSVTGSTRDVVLLILGILLTRNPATPIRRCPECKILFYAAPRQLYHSRQCAHRVTVRNWRESHGKQVAKSKRGRKPKNSQGREA